MASYGYLPFFPMARGTSGDAKSQVLPGLRFGLLPTGGQRLSGGGPSPQSFVEDFFRSGRHMKTSSFFLGILGRVFFEEIGMTGTFGWPGLGLVRSLRRYFLENFHWEFWRIAGQSTGKHCSFQAFPMKCGGFLNPWEPDLVLELIC